MGYLLGSLGSLPIDDSVSLYIFIIDSGFTSPQIKTVEENFREIARRIGADSIIAAGLGEEFSGDICRLYLEKTFDQLFSCLPAILLTDAHPSALNSKSMRLLIPLRLAEKKYGDLSIFFQALSDFAVHRNVEFLKHFEERPDWFATADAIFEIKPEVFGIGININEIIKRFLGRSTSES